jgi:hypothetical protein
LGQTFDPDVVGDDGEDLTPPSCVTASEFQSHPFASLPVDQDCNGIADSWEDQQGSAYSATRATPNGRQGRRAKLPVSQRMACGSLTGTLRL